LYSLSEMKVVFCSRSGFCKLFQAGRQLSTVTPVICKVS
jgi:hypothetical protein